MCKILERKASGLPGETIRTDVRECTKRKLSATLNKTLGCKHKVINR